MGLFAGVIGAIAGGVGAGVGTYLNNMKLAEAYEGYAKDIRKAGKKYSGQNADNAMREAESQEARRLNNLNMGTAASTPNTSNLSMQNALRRMSNVKAADSTMQGQNLGRSNKATELQGKYNAETAKAQQALNQAGINYQVNNQAMQAGMQGLQGLAQAYNQIWSDENVKEDPYDKSGLNNDSGLPNATVDDAMSKIETVTYKYTPEMQKELGLDDEDHVGLIAQSCLKSPLFEDCVIKHDNGYLALDKAKLMSKLPMLISNLKDRIDVLYLQSDKQH